MIPQPKNPKDPPKKTSSTDLSIENDEPKVLVDNLYKKNIELSVKNKTLSLLGKLYEIGILTLEPKDLAMRISQTVQADLSFECVSIFLYEAVTDVLSPLACSVSPRIQIVQDKLGISLHTMSIPDVTKREFFREVISNNKENMTNALAPIWGDLIDANILQTMTRDSNIKTILLHPLMVENRVLGCILFALNRTYDTLSSFEKESVKSIVNVIALSLEKAYLYKKLEDANANLKELDRQKDELLSIVSHQLATPITSIKWYTEMLLDGDLGELNPQQRQHAKSMQSIASNLTDLVSLVLDVSRIDLGRVKMNKDAVELKTLFNEILDVIRPKAIEKGLEFIENVPATLPTAIIDKRYTRMTIENLLSNAVKYTQKGKVELNVRIENGMMHCEVRDTGYGIPVAERDKIFGKLFRASNVRNNIDGNGFGLYIAKGAIESQGGKIWFESEEGKGTVFFIDLPLNAVPPKQEPTAA